MTTGECFANFIDEMTDGVNSISPYGLN